MKKLLSTLAILGGALVATSAMAVPASATFTTPSGNPIVVAGDSSGNPQPFDIVVSGFAPGAHVLVEQCDGVDHTAPGWSPAVHCDLGTSPSYALADGNGVATFPASDHNLGFHPFKNESPQSLFNCLSPHDPALNPDNGLTDFRNCQLKASTSNLVVTADQQFVTLQLPDAGPPPVTPEVPYAVILPIGALVIGGAFLLTRKLRTSRSVA